MIRYQRHTGPVSHPVIDPPEDHCTHCGITGEGSMCTVCEEYSSLLWEDHDEDCEGDDP